MPIEVFTFLGIQVIWLYVSILAFASGVHILVKLIFRE